VFVHSGRPIEIGFWRDGEALVVVSPEYGRLFCHYAGGSMNHQRRITYHKRISR
jgi:hypothetical protein